MPMPVVDRTLVNGIDSRCWPYNLEEAIGGVSVGSSQDVVVVDEHVYMGVRTGASVSEANGDAVGGVRVYGGATESMAEDAVGGVRVYGGATESMAEDAVGGVRVGGSAQVAGLWFNCPYCPDGTHHVWTAEVTGGTGDFASINGTWVFTIVNGCYFGLSTAPAGCFGVIAQTAGNTAISFEGPACTWGSILSRDCLGPLVFVPITIFGVGKPPDPITLIGSD